MGQYNNKNSHDTHHHHQHCYTTTRALNVQTRRQRRRLRRRIAKKTTSVESSAIKSTNHHENEKKEVNNDKTKEEEAASSPPTVRYSYIFPTYLEGSPNGEEEEEVKKINWKESLKDWRRILSVTWKEYVETFEGFLYHAKDKNDPNNENKNGKEDDNDEEKLLKDLEKVQTTVQSNVEKNRAFLQEEGKQVLENVKRNTGIHTREELRRVAADLMKLATTCIQEFTKGYRTGRDDEVDKMLNQTVYDFFNEQEQEKEKAESADTKEKGRRRRRKPKVRIQTVD